MNEKAGEKKHLEDMYTAFLALKECGWREVIYCPKDGTRFLAIEAGSTGVFPCSYIGKWPHGGWWVEAGEEPWSSRPILWKPMPSNVEMTGQQQDAAKPLPAVVDPSRLSC
jgi:hypothetical protein